MNTAVQLVEAYLRLNGFFSATELQVQERVRVSPLGSARGPTGRPQSL